MKKYPSITKKCPDPSKVIWAFDKIDGSNIRVEWFRKHGFSKFASRTRLLGPDQGILFLAETLFRQNHAEELERRFREAGFDRAMVFAEFHGPNSFAGDHVEGEEHRLTLIDLSVHRKGFMDPQEFIEFTEGLDTAPLLYNGPATPEFIQSVRESRLEGVTEEGVVCKGRKTRSGSMMFKIKSDKWLDRLRSYCGDNENLFNKLA